MPGNEAGDARAEQGANRVGTDAGMTVGRVGHERGTDVVNEPGRLELDVVGCPLAQVRGALQRVREQIDVFFVGMDRARLEQVEERAESIDSIGSLTRRVRAAAGDSSPA